MNVFLLFAFVFTGVQPSVEAKIIKDAKSGGVWYGEEVKAPVPTKGWYVILQEDFETGSIPSDWQVVDGNGDGFAWTLYDTTTWDHETPPDCGTYLVGYDDDAAGINPPTEEELILPVLPVDFDTIVLTYSLSYDNYFGNDTLAVRIRTCTGGIWSSWDTLVLYNQDISGAWDTLNLTSFTAGADFFQVEFIWWDHDDPHWDWYVSLDNISIFGIGVFSHDVAVVDIPSPPEVYVWETEYSVITEIENMGQNPETVDVYAMITDTAGTEIYYMDSVKAVALSSGEVLFISFNSWNSDSIGIARFKAWVRCDGDLYVQNDTMEKIIRVGVDGVVDSVTSPPRHSYPGGTYGVYVTYRNDGIASATFDLYAEIECNGNLIFTGSKPDVSIDAGGSFTAYFGDVVIPDTFGTYTITAWMVAPFDMDVSNDTLVEDHSITVWKEAFSLPIPLMDHAVVRSGNKIFVIGGYVKWSSIDSLFIYDLLTGTWTRGANMPKDLCMYDACIMGDTIFIPGGYSYSADTVIDSLYIYSISSNTWSVVPGPGEPAWAYAVVAAGGKIYRIGGYDPSTDTQWKSTWEFDPATGTWTKKKDMNTGREWFEAIVRGDTIFVMGGVDGVTSETYHTTEFYVISGDTWIQDSTLFAYLPEGMWGYGADYHNGYMYVISGVDTTWYLTPRVYRYNFSTNTWERYWDVFLPVYRCKAIGVEGVDPSLDGIYLVGGSTGGFNPTDSCEVSLDTWTGIEERKPEVYLEVPALNHNTLSFVYHGRGPARIDVVNIAGRRVRRVYAIPGMRVEIGGLSPGVYFIISNRGIKKKTLLIR